MASSPEGSFQKKDALTMEEILETENLAEILSENTLTSISQQVFDDYTKDLSSCEERRNKLQDIVAFAKMISKDKSYPWQGASNVIYPLIANSAIDFGATLYPEIIKDSTVVKGKVIGKDEGRPMETAEGIATNEDGSVVMENVGMKKKKGERVAMYMNYVLLDKMNNWEVDMDRLGNSIPVLGNLYKKVYWDSIENEGVSELIYPDKIVINNAATSIKKAIVTQILELYPQEIMQRIRSEMYINFDYDYEIGKENQSDPSDINNTNNLDETKDYGNNTKLRTFYEQHTWLDLDEDGFPEPYVVTVCVEGAKTIRVVKRFKKSSIKYNSKKEVSQIKAKCYFVKYGFIPSPDGSFYDIAFGDLLYNINDSVNTVLNQLFDAGKMAIMGGGFIGKGIRTKGGAIKLSPGEWKMVDNMGGKIAENIVPIPQPAPDPTLFALLQYIAEAGKNMSLLRDVLNGENAANIQSTTYVSMVEQGLKQFKAIYKRIYKSLKEELKLLYEEIGEHTSNQEYAEVLDEPMLDVSVKMDFDSSGYDICPVADIEAVTSMQRMAQTQFYMSFIGVPNVDQVELMKRIMTTAQVEDVEKLVVASPPPVNPLLEVEQLKSQVKMQELQIKAAETQVKNEKMMAELQKVYADIEKLRTAASLDLANVAKIGNEIEDAAQEREIKIMDNIIDGQTKQIEVEGRLKEAQIKLSTEVIKNQREYQKGLHEKDMMSKEKNESTKSE